MKVWMLLRKTGRQDDMKAGKNKDRKGWKHRGREAGRQDKTGRQGGKRQQEYSKREKQEARKT